MPSENPGLLLVGEFLERILVPTRGGSCAASRASWSLHSNSTDDGGSSRTGAMRTIAVAADAGVGRVDWNVPRRDVGYGGSAILGS